MPMHEIPRHHWSSFLDQFSRLHAGCVCSLELEAELDAPCAEATTWPLLGLTLERPPDAPSLTIFVGDRLERHLGHPIRAPRRVWLDETPEGAHTGLCIDTDEGVIRLRFSTPQDPDAQEPFYVEHYLP